MKVICPECNTRQILIPEGWRCDCGGAWEPAESAGLDATQIDTSDYSVWRYRRLLDLDFETPAASLGMGWTPLLPFAWGRRQVLVKLVPHHSDTDKLG